MKKITFYKRIYKRNRLKKNVPNCLSVNLNIGDLLRVITTLAILASHRDGGTSHIAPPDMNSYIAKYEFINPETYEFIHLYEFIFPGDLSLHAYEFIFIQWYIQKMATDGGCMWGGG